jgi:hypothetical protein
MRLSLTPLDLLDASKTDVVRSVTQDIANDIPAEVPVRRRNLPLRILVCAFAIAGFLLVSFVLLGSTLGCG